VIFRWLELVGRYDWGRHSAVKVLEDFGAGHVTGRMGRAVTVAHGTVF